MNDFEKLHRSITAACGVIKAAKEVAASFPEGPIKYLACGSGELKIQCGSEKAEALRTALDVYEKVNGGETASVQVDWR